MTTSIKKDNEILTNLFDTFMDENSKIKGMQILGCEKDKLYTKLYRKVCKKAVALCVGKWIRVTKYYFLYVMMHDDGFNLDGVSLKYIKTPTLFDIDRILTESWKKFSLPWAFTRNERFAIVSEDDVNAFLSAIPLSKEFGQLAWSKHGVSVSIGKQTENNDKLQKTAKEALYECLGNLGVKKIQDTWDEERAREANQL